MTAARELAVVIPLGSNPAPLLALAWALARDGARVVDAWVVAAPRGRAYLEQALAAEWDRLRDAVGGRVPTRAALRVVTAGDDAGGPDATAALGEAVWGAYADAARGERPVVVALGGGRRRAVASLVTTIFTLHGRARDRLVDVRLSPGALERTPAFLYPGQRASSVRVDGAVVDAAAAEVRLDDVPVARVRRLVPRHERPVSFSHAVTLGQRSLDALAVPELVFDLATPRLTLGGAPVSASRAELLVLAGYAAARVTDDGDDGWLWSDTFDAVTLARARAVDAAWPARVQSVVARAALRGASATAHAAAWRKLRSRAARALATAGRRLAPAHAAYFVIEQRKTGTKQLQGRLRLPASAIRFVAP